MSAEIMVVATMPPAHQVAYATPRLMFSSALETNKSTERKKQYKNSVGISFVKPSDAFRSVVAMISRMIAAPNNTYGMFIPPVV